MPCFLTQGFPQDCKESVGGIDKIWVATKNDVQITAPVNGVIASIDVTGDMYEYDLVKESANFAEAINVNVQNGTVFYGQTLEIILNKLQVNTRNEILLLAASTLVIFVKDSNGKIWLLGYENGLDLTAGGSASGTAYGDRNGYTLTFTGNEKQLAPLVTSISPYGI